MGASDYNQKQIDYGNLTIEMITELGRAWQANHPPLAIDGYIGPATQASIANTLHPQPDIPSQDWPPWDGPLARQPKNRTEVYEQFGDPGVGTVDPIWYAKNIVEVQGDRHFPGVPEKWYFKIHRLIEPYAREGFRRAKASSPYIIKRAAGFVFRHMRYDTDRALSYHSWGIAIDIDSDRNYARYFPKDQVPKPWSPEWKAVWPDGLDEDFVEAMASCGWSWGGYWNISYCDPMHFEWVGEGSV